MNKNKSSPYKDSAFSIEMDSAVKGLVSINDSLFAFCEKSIYKIEMGTSRDPDNTNPLSPNTKVKVLAKGTENAIINSFFEYLKGLDKKQFGEIQAITFNPKINIEEIKIHLFDLMMNYSTFEDSYAGIISAYNEQLKYLDIPQKENNFEVEAFIPNLEKQIKDVFITESGSILNKLTRLVILFFQDSLSQKAINCIMSRDKRFDNLLNVISSQNAMNPENELGQLINESCKKFLDQLVDIRNALEHPTSKKNIVIRNFYLLPNRNFTPPLWTLIHPNYPFKESNLIEDIVFYCANLTDFTFLLIKRLIEQGLDAYYFCENGGMYRYSKELEEKEKK